MILNYCLLLLMGAMWGSAYATSKIALEAFSPMELVVLRLGLAAALLIVMVWWQRQHLAWRGLWCWLLGMAFIGLALPFYLISWGQLYVDSGLTAILIAATPFFAVAGAHFIFADEKLTPLRLLGLLASFSGVCILIGPGALAYLGGGDMAAELAILAGAACYGATMLLARKMPEAPSMAKSANLCLVSFLLTLPLALFGIEPTSTGGDMPIAMRHILAVISTGLFPTALATIIFFILISRAGAGFTSLGNYIAPLAALALSYWAMGETIQVHFLPALGLILLGIILARPQAERFRAEKSALADNPRSAL